MSGLPGPAQHVDVAADKVVKAAGGQLVAVHLTAAATTATLTLYDNASAASGTVLAKLSAPTLETVPFCPAIPYVATNGIYADIGGTGANATVVFL